MMAQARRIADLRVFSSAWQMSAALVASAHKTVHISLSRDEADGAILIERAFAGISSGNFAMFAAILRASSFVSSLAADSPVASPLGTVTDVTARSIGFS
jgi:hypothetical protein